MQKEAIFMKLNRNIAYVYTITAFIYCIIAVADQRILWWTGPLWASNAIIILWIEGRS